MNNFDELSKKLSELNERGVKVKSIVMDVDGSPLHLEFNHTLGKALYRVSEDETFSNHFRVEITKDSVFYVSEKIEEGSSLHIENVLAYNGYPVTKPHENTPEGFSKSSLSFNTSYITEELKSYAKSVKPSGLYLKGVAGSGKTSVALWRSSLKLIAGLKEKGSDYKVLYTTYNKTPIENIKNNIEKLANMFIDKGELSKELKAVFIENFNLSTVDALTSKQTLIPGKTVDYNLIDVCIEKAKNETLKENDFLRSLPCGFFRNLFEFCLIQSQMTKDYFLEHFVFHNFHAQFSVEDKEKIWTILENIKGEQYFSSVYVSKSFMAADAIKLIQEKDKYDIVTIDEGQDLTASQLEFLIASLKNNDLSNLTIVFDDSQTLYNQFFDSNEFLPLSLKNKVDKKHLKPISLQTSFRNPKQIENLATDLRNKIKRKKSQHLTISSSSITGAIYRLAPTNNVHCTVLTAKKADCDSTVFSYKGLEGQRIYFKDADIPYYLYKDYEHIRNHIHLNFSIHPIKFTTLFYDLLKESLEHGTAHTSTKLDDILKRHGHKPHDALKRSLRALLSTVDSIFCFYYVAITRTNNELYITCSPKGFHKECSNMIFDYLLRNTSDEPMAA